MIREGAISISLPSNCQARRFDGSEHGMSHCMKAVDFILDTPLARIFLEIKDPDAAESPDTSLQYAERLCAGQIDQDLYYKYRDSWLYVHAKNDIRRAVPNYYFVLLGLATFSTESISGRSLSLQQKVSIQGPNGPWNKPFVDQVFVFNLESWNRNFPQLIASRN